MNPFGDSSDSDADGRGATATIHLSGVSGSSIIPDVEALVDLYSVTLSRSGYSERTGSGPGTVEISNVALGVWDVEVEALDAASSVIGTGSGTVDVTVGGGSTMITVAPTTGGSGDLDFTIEWTPAGLIAGIQEATFTPAGASPGPDISAAFTTAGSSVTYNPAGVISGQYVMIVKLENGDEDHVATVIESVHIYDNVLSSGTISLTSSDIAQPPVAPTIQSATETPAGSGSVELTWSDNSDVEEQYQVAYSSDGGSTYSTPVDVGPNTTSHTVSGLDPDTTYTLRVTGENSFGSTEDTVVITTGSISVYHVSATTGDDGNNGRQDAPLATITEALSRASSGDEIRVAGGTYNEVVTVNKPVSIYGSYNAAFTSRSLDPPTSFIEAGGTGSYSVRFREDGGTITNAVYFDGFDVSIGGTRTSSWTEAITISDGAPTISNNRLTGWNGASAYAAAVNIGSSRGASALFENNYMVGSYDGPWTVTIKAYDDASPVFRNNQIYGTLDGGGGGGTGYVYLTRPSTTGKITFISNYMDVGVNVASSAKLRGLALEGETDADIFGNVITTGQTTSSSSVMYPIQIGYNGVDADSNGIDEPLNVRIYGNTIYTGSGGDYRAGINVVQSTGDIEIVNNIVVITPTSGTAYWMRVNGPANGIPVRLENNAFSGPGDYLIGSTSLTTAADLNTAGTATASAGDVAAGNIIATPSFTDPTNGDFTLDGDTSSAIGEGGLDLSGIIGFPAADLGGTSRTTPWSIGAYEFDGPFASGSAEVSITFDNPDDPDVSFSGAADGASVSQSTPLTLTAPASYTSYTWYLDGDPAASELTVSTTSTTDDTATVATGALSLGTHSVAVVVGDGTNLYSAQVDFTVVQ